MRFLSALHLHHYFVVQTREGVPTFLIENNDER